MYRMRKWVFAAAMAVATGACSTVFARPATARNEAAPTDVDAVLHRYYDAIGGYARMKSIVTRHLLGEYVEGAIHGATEISQERPQLRRVNLHTAKWDHIEGFDGQTWEYHRDAGQVHGHLTRDPVGSPADLAQRRGSEFDESFVDYRVRGFHAALLGREQLGSVVVDRVRITRNDNWTVDYYFDVATGLLVAVGKAMPVHAEGDNVESLTFYSDWRSVKGLLVPFAGEERNAKTGAVMNTLRWSVVELNVPLTRADLLPPE